MSTNVPDDGIDFDASVGEVEEDFETRSIYMCLF